MLFPFLAGLCFGSWPLFMRSTGFSGPQSGFVVSVVTLVVFIPLWRGDTAGFNQKALALGVAAGLLNGLGSIFYQAALANLKLEVSRVLLVVLVTTILVSTVGARLFYGELLDTQKLFGLSFSLIGVLLLTL
jgi:uncharacterized membrane protein